LQKKFLKITGVDNGNTFDSNESFSLKDLNKQLQTKTSYKKKVFLKIHEKNTEKVHNKFK